MTNMNEQKNKGGRPPKGRVATKVTLDPANLERVNKKAQELGLDRSSFLNELIKKHVKTA